jgi:hypothetical protein
MNVTASNSYVLLDGLLLDVKIMECLEKTKVPEEVFDDRYAIFDLHIREKKIQEFKILTETKDPLLDLDKSSLHELNILRKNSNDPSINIYQAEFGSYIVNYVIK